MSENRKKQKFMAIPVEKHTSAAWTNIHQTKPESNVTIPSEIEVRNAKEWVDSNEK